MTRRDGAPAGMTRKGCGRDDEKGRRSGQDDEKGRRCGRDDKQNGRGRNQLKWERPSGRDFSGLAIAWCLLADLEC